MARPRKTYTAECKRNAVRLVTDQKLSDADATRRLGVGADLLRLWERAIVDRGTDAFPGHGRLCPADEEPHRVRAEVTRLKGERDLLKKAAAYFASPPS